MDGWTTVRYGRRRHRNPQPAFRDWGAGRPDGWRASAPSLPYRREYFPHPNQRVPPPRANWFSGHRYRSYADVVRQGGFQPSRTGYPPRGGGPAIRREAADPTFGRLIRKIYAVTKTVHHLQNVAPKPGKEEPRMITRMVEVLSRMIKPAASTRRTRDFITGNAKNWGHNTCLILMEHYEKCLEDFLEDLADFLTPDWKEAFEVAVRWARRNLPRITQDAIDHTEALISAQVDGRDPTRVPPQQNMAAAPAQDRARDQPQTRDPVQVPLQQNGTTARTQDQATNTSELDRQPRDQQDWFNVPSPSISMAGDPPQDRREVRGRDRRIRGTILTEDSIVEDPEPARHDGEREASAHRSITQAELEAIFDELHREEEEENLLTSTPREKKKSTVAQVHQESEEEEEEENFVDSPDHFVQPGPLISRVFRHPNTQRKLTRWTLDVYRKVLIMGDSNLDSFPAFSNRNLQVECYPEGHFRHAQVLIEKQNPQRGLVVEKIILSFGIYSRSNKFKETTIKAVQGALRATREKFPYADIWIPLVNFSPALPQEERDNLEELNAHLKRNMPFIPLLPEGKFETEMDNIHWTAETGKAMLDHWLNFLNARTP